MSKTPGVGHNVGGVDTTRLVDLVERIENLEEEKAGIGESIKGVYEEAKKAGFDLKTLRRVIRERKQDPADLEEQETLLGIYRKALGPFVDTPLGAAAMERAT